VLVCLRALARCANRRYQLPMPPPLDVPPIASEPPAPSPASPRSADLPPAPKPSISELFFAFFSMALHGFGGVLPWARRAIVEDKRWMTAQEFNEAFAIGQFLPGANIVNLAVVFGGRLHGAAGAAVALAGLLIPPVAIVLTLGVLYSRYGEAEALQRVLGGVAAAAAGLLLAIVVKMLQPLLREGVGAWVVTAAAFVAVGVMRLPLPYVLLVMAPISIALAWWVRR
jgi:chromate transporter